MGGDLVFLLMLAVSHQAVAIAPNLVLILTDE